MPCLDCGFPMEVQIRDGEIIKAEPQELLAYVAVPFWKWFEDVAFA
jgi:hypothetical protein